ncbi:winged helix-turn-helix transcriptional regulator [Gallaecimonas mangrovi]|uniref:winged helix-turn-helix transcriptional regulator n=1 Tax=Gallaecimonas mangrovi TaxID=2291597 RepID=UPI000E20BB47|nr:helix-turn-helix domain-containing protein [Gallaecimonas mangrovi]
MAPEPLTIYRADCPSRPILDQLISKWSMLVLQVLDEPKRFNMIKRQLDGITQRVLTETLRKLERSGMVTRRVLETSPIGVEYALTPMGQSLKVVFSSLYDWTVTNMRDIEETQQAYDLQR